MQQRFLGHSLSEQQWQHKVLQHIGYEKAAEKGICVHIERVQPLHLEMRRNGEKIVIGGKRSKMIIVAAVENAMKNRGDET
jgi:hypothetical protein